MMSKIDPEAVNAAFLDCLFRDEEVVNGQIPDGAVVVDGILHRFAFNPERLEGHRSEIREWLLALPKPFLESGGGGWSFLNACDDSDGNQWTGLHQRMGQLFDLGVGLGLAKCLVPREMWGMMPGGMPYYVVPDKADSNHKPDKKCGL